MNEYLTAVSVVAAILTPIFLVIYTEKRFRRFDTLLDSASQLLRFEEDENGNVLVDARVAKLVEQFGSAIAKSLKMSFLGSLSGQARLEKGLKSAVAADLIEQRAPLLNLIGDFLGINTKKYIMKHPEAFLQLAQQFAPFLAKKGGFAPQNNSGGELGKIG